MMTKLLQRYIAKSIILATGLTSVIVAAVLFLMTLLTELKNVGEGDYGFAQALMYVVMRMPAELYHFAPMLVLLGGIAGLSVLTTYRELAVMRAAGFSIKQIVYSVLSAALILTLAMAVVGEFVAPKLSHSAEVSKENNKNGGQAVVTASGVWLHVDDNFIHIEQVIGKDQLQGVTRYQFDDHHHLLAAYYAKSLVLIDNQWVMQDAVKTTFLRDHTSSEVMASAPWGVKFNANLPILNADPADMSLPHLVKVAHNLEKNGLQSSGYRYEFWQRLFQPLASLTMIFLAIPFVLGAMRGSTLGFRIVAGILVGFAFFILNSLLGQVCIVYQVPAVLAAFIPILLFTGVGFILSRQMVRL